MDPYLERRWGTVHGTLISAIQAALQGKLPPGLRARGEQDVFLEDADDEQRILFEGDIAVVETSAGAPHFEGDAGAVGVAVAPVVIRLEPVIARQRWVQIIDTTDGNRIVTVIEILSPGNKSSSDLNKRYRKQLSENVRAGVNIAEIDLLRSSRSRLLIPEENIPVRRRAPYYTCVNWAKDPGRWEIFPMPLRDRLPIVPIPCRETDADVMLDLQPVIDRVCTEGGHDDIDYGKPPEPPFDADDNAWATEKVAQPRKR